MKKRSSFKTVRNLLFFVFLALFIASASILAVDIFGRKKGNQIYEEARSSFVGSVLADLPGDSLSQVIKLEEDDEYDAEDGLDHQMNGEGDVAGEPEENKNEHNEILEKVRGALDSLKQVNTDVCGWIRIEGTSIDYPIVKGEDNEKYLNYAYNGYYSPLGSIFADYRCSDSIRDNRNTVLYGHNLMTGGSDMFHDVEMFLDQSFFDSAEIVLYTYDGIYYFEPFSVYETRYDYNYYKTDFDSQEEFLSFANKLKGNSKCESGVSFDSGDYILTLSTCTNRQYFTRYALHAKLIKAIEE